MPEGFEQTSKTNNDVRITTKYESNKGDSIVFSQRITSGNSGWAVDIEQGGIKSETIDGIDIKFYESEEEKIVIWLKDGYVFVLNCQADIGIDTIKQIALSIK